MATPITTIKKETKTAEQIKLEKIEELKELLAENEDAVSTALAGPNPFSRFVYFKACLK